MRQGRAVLVLLAGAAGTLALTSLGWLGGYRINLTPSYPLGLWRIEGFHRDVEVGDLVFICPPTTSAFGMAHDRGYVRSGLCPGWYAPLIKTVVARSGQHAEIGRDVIIDGEALPSSQVRHRDAEGRPLAPAASGIVPAGHLFLHSDFAGSYDSRYFGAIPADGVLGLARPLHTFNP